MTLQTSEPNNSFENDTRGNQRTLLTGLLVGPVVYTLYFFTSYLWIETACRENLAQFSLLGLDGIAITVLGLTIAALLIILTVALYIYRSQPTTETSDAQDNRRFVKKVGLWLSGFFVIVTVVTGLPVVFLELCSWL